MPSLVELAIPLIFALPYCAVIAYKMMKGQDIPLKRFGRRYELVLRRTKRKNDE